MKKEFADLANYRLEKAKNTLSDGKKYIKDATLESTVNRIYYAMFYAVSALLISKELSSSKHSGILAVFNKEIVNKGFIKRLWGEFYFVASRNIGNHSRGILISLLSRSRICIISESNHTSVAITSEVLILKIFISTSP